MGLMAHIREWWNEKKLQMLVGMELQLQKYPADDPRYKAVQAKIDKHRESIDMGDEDGSKEH